MFKKIRTKAIQKNPLTHRQAMMKFYTGGPIESPFQNKTMTLSSTCTQYFMKSNKKYRTD